ncbi:hypothetical protein I4U23_029629 [Adineta vaga]|nr:hypothetical protein I4U23_029629 [Adineta vaga]
MYLLQCCRQPWQDDQYDADPKLWYTRSFVPNTYRNHPNRQTTGNDTFVRRKTYYTPARDHSLLFRQNVKYESQPTIYFHQSAVQQSNTDSLNYAVIQDHPPSIINEIYSSTSSEMSGHDSESIYLTIRSLKLGNQSTELSTDIDEYHNAGIDEVKFNFKELVRIHKPNEPYKEFFLTSALSSLPIFPENETDQSDHIIQDTVHIQPIQTILESIDNSEASALPVSSRVRYNKQPEIHY